MYETIQDIKDANARKGHHFFERATMRFFKSKVYPKVYGGKYFITAETGPSKITKFTIRKAYEDGRVSSFSRFQEFDNKSYAVYVVKNLVKLEAEFMAKGIEILDTEQVVEYMKNVE